MLRCLLHIFIACPFLRYVVMDLLSFHFKFIHCTSRKSETHCKMKDKQMLIAFPPAHSHTSHRQVCVSLYATLCSLAHQQLPPACCDFIFNGCATPRVCMYHGAQSSHGGLPGFSPFPMDTRSVAWNIHRQEGFSLRQDGFLGRDPQSGKKAWVHWSSPDLASHPPSTLVPSVLVNLG